MLSLLVALTASASAATPQWSWPVGTPQLFHLETEISSPRGRRYYKVDNVDAMAMDVHVVADTTCTAATQGKQNWVVSCTFAYVKVTGHGYNGGEQEKLDTVLTEWSSRIGTSTIVMTQGRDGKIKLFDLQGLKSVNSRDSAILEAYRALLQRTFSLFELRLPAADDTDTWKRGWEEKGITSILELQTSAGTAGAAHVKYQPKGDHGGMYDIQTSGNAVVSAGSALDEGIGTYAVDVTVLGGTTFDIAAGLPAYRSLSLQGYRTVSSNDTGNDAEFAQLSALQRVDAFGKDGAAPLPLAATLADKLADPPPEAPAGVPIVAFQDLGMAALFIPSMPDDAKALGLPASKVAARVVVDGTGKVTTVTAYSGYAALAPHAEQALRACHFPVRDAKPYVVDVEVEFRTE
jgi:hypothetical protein